MSSRAFWEIPAPSAQPTAAATAEGSASISVAAVNPALFLQGFRLRVCPTKPVPWDLLKTLDFDSLRLAPPDLDKIKSITLALIDANFDASTLFGETTVQVRGGSYMTRPVPSVSDLVMLTRSLQCALQFNLHSIQALKDQVRKQQTINNSFEAELRRLTSEHVSTTSALARTRDMQINTLDDRICKIVEENTKLKEQLTNAESRAREVVTEHQTALLSWKEERMRLCQENYTLRQFVAGNGGGLDSEAHKMVVDGILNKNKIQQSASASGGEKKHRHHHHHHHRDPDHHNHHRHEEDKNNCRKSSKSHHHHHHQHRVDTVSCSKCHRGALRPIPVAFVNSSSDPQQQQQQGGGGEQKKNISPELPLSPNKQQQQQQQQNSNNNNNNNNNSSRGFNLPTAPPASAMESIRMQDNLDKARVQSDEHFSRLASMMKQQGDELRNSMKVVEDVAQRSIQTSGDADSRQRHATEKLSDAVQELHSAQISSETKMLGKISESDARVREHVQNIGNVLSQETNAVTNAVVDLTKRVSKLEGGGNKQQPQQEQEYNHQQYEPQEQEKQQQQQQQQHHHQQASPFSVQPKMVVLPLSKTNSGNNSRSQSVDITQQQQRRSSDSASAAGTETSPPRRSSTPVYPSSSSSSGTYVAAANNSSNTVNNNAIPSQQSEEQGQQQQQQQQQQKEGNPVDPNDSSSAPNSLAQTANNNIDNNTEKIPLTEVSLLKIQKPEQQQHVEEDDENTPQQQTPREEIEKEEQDDEQDLQQQQQQQEGEEVKKAAAEKSFSDDGDDERDKKKQQQQQQNSSSSAIISSSSSNQSSSVSTAKKNKRTTLLSRVAEDTDSDDEEARGGGVSTSNANQKQKPQEDDDEEEEEPHQQPALQGVIGSSSSSSSSVLQSPFRGERESEKLKRELAALEEEHAALSASKK